MSKLTAEAFIERAMRRVNSLPEEACGQRVDSHYGERVATKPEIERFAAVIREDLESALSNVGFLRD